MLVEVLRALLDGGADANACNNRGKAALHDAAYDGSLEKVKELISHGAAVDPALTAWCVGALGIEGTTPLMFAAEYGHTNVVHALLKHGASKTAVDADGKNALARAVGKGGTDMLLALLEP